MSALDLEPLRAIKLTLCTGRGSMPCCTSCSQQGAHANTICSLGALLAALPEATFGLVAWSRVGSAGCAHSSSAAHPQAASSPQHRHSTFTSFKKPPEELFVGPFCFRSLPQCSPTCSEAGLQGERNSRSRACGCAGMGISTGRQNPCCGYVVSPAKYLPNTSLAKTGYFLVDSQQFNEDPLTPARLYFHIQLCSFICISLSGRLLIFCIPLHGVFLFPCICRQRISTHLSPRQMARSTLACLPVISLCLLHPWPFSEQQVESSCLSSSTLPQRFRLTLTLSFTPHILILPLLLHSSLPLLCTCLHAALTAGDGHR